MANVIDSITIGSSDCTLTTPYGTCGTAAGTAAKVVSDCANFLSLETGARITIKFTNANTAANPTLNVNSKGAKSIYHSGAAVTSTNSWYAGQVIDFVYDGTYWQIIDGQSSKIKYNAVTDTVIFG